MIEIRYGQKIRTEGYFDGLKSIKEQIREDIETTQETLLTDIIRCLETLQTDTPELSIVIIKKHGKPFVIQKTWTVNKESV